MYEFSICLTGGLIKFGDLTYGGSIYPDAHFSESNEWELTGQRGGGDDHIVIEAVRLLNTGCNVNIKLSTRKCSTNFFTYVGIVTSAAIIKHRDTDATPENPESWLKIKVTIDNPINQLCACEHDTTDSTKSGSGYMKRAAMQVMNLDTTTFYPACIVPSFHAHGPLTCALFKGKGTSLNMTMKHFNFNN